VPDVEGQPPGLGVSRPRPGNTGFTGLPTNTVAQFAALSHTAAEIGTGTSSAQAVACARWLGRPADHVELAKFSTMPPHPEVPAALRKLRAQVATMTNAVYCSGFETSSDDPFRLGAPPYDGKRRRRVCLIKIICRVFALSRHKVRVAHRIFKLAGQAAAPRAIGEHQNGGSTSRASSFSISARLEHNKNENARSRVQPVI
jgi:hypothetical protein